jgi:hypothetical protein
MLMRWHPPVQGGSGMGPPQGMGNAGPAMNMAMGMGNMAGMAMGARPGIANVDLNSLPAEARDTIYIDVLPPDITRRELAHIFRPFEGFQVSSWEQGMQRGALGSGSACLLLVLCGASACMLHAPWKVDWPPMAPDGAGVASRCIGWGRCT